MKEENSHKRKKKKKKKISVWEELKIRNIERNMEWNVLNKKRETEKEDEEISR